MKNKKFILWSIIMLGLLSSAVFAESPAVRVKDVASVFGARSNQLVGFGLVVGLKGTGDTKSVFTDKAFTNLLASLGMARDSAAYKSRNIAAVMVTSELPAFVKPGQKIDVMVSSVGDASSLKGGTLVQTPIKGADDQVYVVAQGSVMVNQPSKLQERKDSVETVGRVVEGGMVEKEVKVELVNKNQLKLLVRRPDFTTATRLANSLDRGGYSGTKPLDASTIVVPLSADDKENIVAFISQLEDFLVIPDAVAKVVLDQKTGTIVIGENVRLAPVAITHGSFEITIKPAEGQAVGTEAGAPTEAGVGPEALAATSNSDGQAKFVQLEAGASLSSLVKLLNSLGASPRDLVSIVQALKAAGALTAEIEVI